MNRCKLAPEVRRECVGLVCGYEKRKKDYLREVQGILTGSWGDDKAAIIVKLEKKEEVKKMRAVGRALAEIEPDLRGVLLTSIVTRTPFMYLWVEGYSEASFNRRRKMLLYRVAENMGFLKGMEVEDG